MANEIIVCGPLSSCDEVTPCVDVGAARLSLRVGLCPPSLDTDQGLTSPGLDVMCYVVGGA